MQTFAELLTTHRASAGATQRALADAVGAQETTLRHWESGVRLPAARGLVDGLARALELEEGDARALVAAWQLGRRGRAP